MTTPRDAVKTREEVILDACYEWGPTREGMPSVSRIVAAAFDAGFAAGRAAERADMESLWEAAGAMQELAAGEATKGQLRTMALVLIDRLLAMAVSKS